MEIEEETLEISKEYTRSVVQFAEDNGVEMEEDYNELKELSERLIGQILQNEMNEQKKW